MSYYYNTIGNRFYFPERGLEPPESWGNYLPPPDDDDDEEEVDD